MLVLEIRNLLVGWEGGGWDIFILCEWLWVLVMVVVVPRRRIVMTIILSLWHLVLNVPFIAGQCKGLPCPGRYRNSYPTSQYSRGRWCSVPHARHLDLGQRRGLSSMVKGMCQAVYIGPISS